MHQRCIEWKCLEAGGTEICMLKFPTWALLKTVKCQLLGHGVGTSLKCLAHEDANIYSPLILCIIFCLFNDDFLFILYTWHKRVQRDGVWEAKTLTCTWCLQYVRDCTGWFTNILIINSSTTCARQCPAFRGSVMAGWRASLQKKNHTFNHSTSSIMVIFNPINN